MKAEVEKEQQEADIRQEVLQEMQQLMTSHEQQKKEAVTAAKGEALENKEQVRGNLNCCGLECCWPSIATASRFQLCPWCLIVRSG